MIGLPQQQSGYNYFMTFTVALESNFVTLFLTGSGVTYFAGEPKRFSISCYASLFYEKFNDYCLVLSIFLSISAETFGPLIILFEMRCEGNLP